MPNEDLTQLSVANLAPLIQSGGISPVEVAKAFISRIDALEPRLNAFITRMDDAALREAREAEKEILRGQNREHPIHSLQPVETAERFMAIKSLVPEITISEEVMQYILEIVAQTRRSEFLKIGASPRASLALTKLSQAMALIEGESYVKPKHVLELVKPVLCHRLSLNAEARLTELSIEKHLEDLLKKVVAPVGQ